MRNVLLHSEIVLDILAERDPHHRAICSLWEKLETRGIQLWVNSADLPLICHLLADELKAGKGHEAQMMARKKLAQFLEKVKILSCHSYECEGIWATSVPHDSLLLRVAEKLGDDCVILSHSLESVNSRVVTIETIEKQLQEKSDATFPFVDLRRQQHRVLIDVERGLAGVLRHGMYIMGPEISRLEEELSRYLGVKHTITCSSGTDALLMGLMSYQVGPGDAVFTTPFTFIATAEVISLTGATPVFVDIDPVTFNIDPQKLSQAIAQVKEENKLVTKGIITVDLFGLPAEYREINSIAAEHGLFVFEDMAQSFGATYHGRKAGVLTDVAATSFFPAKPLGGYGDAGAVFTDDDELATKLRSIRVHGEGKDKYHNVRIGLNGRCDSFQAAILLAKLAIFPEELQKRGEIAASYSEKLANVVRIPEVPAGLSSAWAQYSILSDHRDRCRTALQEAGIPSAIYYPIPLHLQSAFSQLNYSRGDFPISESAAERIFSIPIHPYLSQEQTDRVVEIIKATLR